MGTKRKATYSHGYKVGQALRGGFKLARAGYNAYKKYKQSTSTNKSNKADGAFLTAQQDTKNVYKSRRMPRGKKRAYKRKISLFRALTDLHNPQRVFLLQNMEKVTYAVNTSVYTGAIMGRFDNDKEEISIKEALDKWLPENAAASSNESRLNNTKVELDSAILRVVLRNANTPVGNESGVMDIDVYQVVCRQDLPDAGFADTYTVGDWLAIQQFKQRRSRGMDFPTFGSGTSNTTFGGDTIAATTAANQSVGSTLFDNTQGTKYFKIIKWTKVQLPVGGVTEFSFKMFKNKQINLSDVYPYVSDGAPGRVAFKKGITQGFIINVNGRAYDVGTGTISNEAGTLYIERYVRYSFKPMKEIGGVTLDMQRTFE